MSSQHVPIRQKYGEQRKSKKWREKNHMYACKVLSVSQKTPNTLIYGELCRYPLYINMLTKAVKYWLKLVELPHNRLPKAAYETVKKSRQQGSENMGQWHKDMSVPIWLLPWVSQQVGNKTGFLQELKQHLIDCNIQDWHNKISTKERFERFENYRSFKQILQFKRYSHSFRITRC